MNKIRIRTPKTLLAVLFSIALVLVTAAFTPQGGDRGFTISGKQLIIKKDFVGTRDANNTVTVRRRTVATTTGTTTCKCTGGKEGCTVKDAPDTEDGGKVQLCGGKSCCDWR